jgi:hypothetical protein
MDKEFKKKIVDCYNATELLFEENVITGDKRDEYERQLLHQVAGRYAIELQSAKEKENKEISNKEEPKKFCGKELGDIVNCTIVKASSILSLPNNINTIIKDENGNSCKSTMLYGHKMRICYMNSKKICLLGCEPIIELDWEDAIDFRCDISIPAGELFDEDRIINNVRIPAIDDIAITTANSKTDFNYWTTTQDGSDNNDAYYVDGLGYISSINKNTYIGIIPYLSINL